MYDSMTNEELTRWLVGQHRAGLIPADALDVAESRGFDLSVLQWHMPPCPDCGKPAGQSGLCGPHNTEALKQVTNGRYP